MKYFGNIIIDYLRQTNTPLARMVFWKICNMKVYAVTCEAVRAME